jgi:hypothetical protein
MFAPAIKATGETSQSPSRHNELSPVLNERKNYSQPKRLRENVSSDTTGVWCQGVVT